MRKLNNSKIYILSEKIQILSWLLKQCNISSTLKIVFLTELLYGSRDKVSDLNRYNTKNDYFGKVCKYSNIGIEKISLTINDSFICLDILKKNNIISINDNCIKILKDIRNVDLSYLTNKTRNGIIAVNSLSDESFLDEVLKYV